MLDEKEVAEIIESDKKKKKVSWNDKKEEGKMDMDSLTFGTSATPSKAKVDKAITQLIKEGYSEVEAASLMGKPITPSGELILNNPTFYESKENIKGRLALRKEKQLSLEKEVQTNRYTFFSMSNIGLGVAVLTAAAVIGVAVSRNK
ncbi:Uncharacterised protein [Legionella lansingensis]|uniref:Uncharacterized protein n=1 Tax=Legionella lansingensis TaxID=45067 RepID=A0A0W0VHI5_9GAMM|nr:hypothetical protein [Legionella lansingensis]KTD19607.1 hypothetical protein Llan_2069 [Legionella lansingensis]SNV50213.1 Uncharacterised protein [Legionella lansingensis]